MARNRRRMNFVDVMPGEARVNVTWRGQNGDLLDPVPYDASAENIRRWVAEAIGTGSVQGVQANGHVNLRDFVVDRFPPTAQIPYARIFVRPKTPFG